MQRFGALLDAAGELVREGGYAAVTTSAVAARAGVSVGSLYQFFPDRVAVLQALARRSFERFTALLVERVQNAAPRTWQTLVDLVVDTYVDVTVSEPSGRSLSFGGFMDRRTLAPGADNNMVVAELLGELLTSVRPDVVVDASLRAALRVAVEAGDSVLMLAMNSSDEPDPVLVEETKVLLRAYLGRHIPARRRGIRT